MSGSRLVELRESLKLSQQEFAHKTGITQGALSQLETSKSKLSLDTIYKISRAFGVDCNWLVTGEGAIFVNDTSSEKKRVGKSNNRNVPKGFVPLIRGEAHAGYIENYMDEKYLETLEVYKIPGYESGSYRLFEIEGDSMIPTIYPGEIVVTEKLADQTSVENGALCIVVTFEGIVAKRVYIYAEDKNGLILKSDNIEYRTYSVPMSNVREIWLVRAKITSIFAQSQIIDASKIRELETDIMALKREMSLLSSTNKTPNSDPAP